MKRALCLILAILCTLSVLGCSIESPGTDQQLLNELSPSVDGWELVLKEEQTIVSGVNYIKAHFKDKAGLPHIAYILTVNPKKATLYKGTSNNLAEVSPSEAQNVLEHMQASRADGFDVVAAVNGDFFSTRGGYMPSAVSVKNGNILRENNSFRPFCAITKDGQYIISDGRQKAVDLNTLQMATGGSHVLIKNGILYDVFQNDDFSNISHPRTLSGIREDQTILLVVIDGRQKAHSNGATLFQCGQLMLSLGATDAINHDGGGSSTMVLYSDNEYQVVNSPSDGSLRDVFCSIQIIMK